MSRLVRPLPVGGSSLVRDYLQGAPAALSFYGGSPYLLDSFRRKLEEVSGRFGPDERAAAARSLRPTSERARERLYRFVSDGGAMVTTGQQAGFLTGPLYTVYKALSAAALARHLETALNTLVLPVFWVASEDHDWEEVNHAFLLDPHNRLRRIQLDSADPRPLPMSTRRLGGDLDDVSDEIIQTAAASEATADWLRRILDPYLRPEVTVADAFAEAMAELLAPVDFLIADAANPELKEIAIPVFRRALVEGEDQQRRLEERSRALTDAGYREQVAVLDRGTNVFHHTEEGRERLYRRGEGLGIRGRKEQMSVDELVALLEAEPGRFSGNVFLRPVVESWVYPTLAYVGGPGEIAYFAQVSALFEAYGMLPPVVVPRFAGQVVEPKVERLLERLRLTVEDAEQPRDALIERLARREMPPEVADVLADIRAEVAGDFGKLLDAAAAVDAPLAGAVGASRNRTLLEATRMERKILRAIKRSDRIAVDQLDRVLHSLRPNGAPQDRVLNVLPFLARYGDHFLREVNRAIEEGWRLPE